MTSAIDRLAQLIDAYGPALVLTGAGCSTASGIPDYRDRDGEWKHKRPVMYQDFVRDELVRRRYWARSMNGWLRVDSAEPNTAHEGLARLEADGFLDSLITQNVDGLHQRAGSRRVLDLHGRLERVRCLDCNAAYPRRSIQARLVDANQEFLTTPSIVAPDGDADLSGVDYSVFVVPDCQDCGGMLKPDVVFYGESIPRSRIAASLESLERAGCLLVVGSSLMVFSGYRYCREAARLGKPVLAINLGVTRADDLFTLKLEVDCGQALTALSRTLSGTGQMPQYVQ